MVNILVGVGVVVQHVVACYDVVGLCYSVV
jgi:hypothetical protein